MIVYSSQLSSGAISDQTSMATLTPEAISPQ
jgi:hypothetical protein